MKPLISICIPTYNGQEYLKQCLESCISQTYANYEIIICDDCSSDDTVKIINEYKLKCDIIKLYVNENNLGLVGNWNSCIEKANGDWIKFVFQDDYILENCLERFSENIDDKTKLIVCKRNFLLPNNATTDYINYYTHVVKTLENIDLPVLKYYTEKQLSSVAIKYFCMNYIAEPSLILFKKDIIKQLGNFNNEFIQICDFEFALRISSNYGLSYIPEKLCGFRIHNNTTTATNVETKSFILKYIEPLLLAHYMLFDKQYERFRKHLSLINKLKLQLHFYVKAYRANLINEKMNFNHPIFTSTSKFKQIYKNRNGNLLIKLISKFI